MEQLRFDFDKPKEQLTIAFPDLPDLKGKIVKEITMQQTAKYLAITYKKFTNILVEKQVLGKNNVGRYGPFEKYVHLGWFIVRFPHVERKGFSGKVLKVTVTPLGFKEIKELVNGK